MATKRRKHAKFGVFIDISTSEHTIFLNFVYAFFINTTLIYVKKEKNHGMWRGLIREFEDILQIFPFLMQRIVVESRGKLVLILNSMSSLSLFSQ